MKIFEMKQILNKIILKFKFNIKSVEVRGYQPTVPAKQQSHRHEHHADDVNEQSSVPFQGVLRVEDAGVVDVPARRRRQRTRDGRDRIALLEDQTVHDGLGEQSALRQRLLVVLQDLTVKY